MVIVRRPRHRSLHTGASEQIVRQSMQCNAHPLRRLARAEAGARRVVCWERTRFTVSGTCHVATHSTGRTNLIDWRQLTVRAADIAVAWNDGCLSTAHDVRPASRNFQISRRRPMAFGACWSSVSAAAAAAAARRPTQRRF